MITIRVIDSRSGSSIHAPCRTPGQTPSPTAGHHGSRGCPLGSATMALYAAYGSNMDPSHMLQRCPSSPVAGTGWLPGWRLTFGGGDLGWDGALAMVVEDPDSAVFVVLYDMADTDERTRDSWEGADLGLYSKIRLRVQTLEGCLLAWLYALQAFEGGLPSARYIGVIADAAEAAAAPAEYVKDLRERPTRSPGTG